MSIDKWVERAKAVAGLAAILYGFGFIVVRARMNVLGVWSSLPFVDSRYLEEGWLFCSITLWNLALCLAPVTLTSCIAWFLLRLRKSRPKGTPTANDERVQKLQMAALSFVALLFPFVCGWTLTVEATLLTGGTHVPPRILYYVALLYTAAAGMTTWWLWSVRHVARSYCWFALLATSVLLVVVLPTSHATHMRSGRFYRANVKADLELNNVCLIEMTSESLVVSSARNVNTIIPRSTVKRIEILHAACSVRQ